MIASISVYRFDKTSNFQCFLISLSRFTDHEHTTHSLYEVSETQIQSQKKTTWRLCINARDIIRDTNSVIKNNMERVCQSTRCLCSLDRSQGTDISDLPRLADLACPFSPKWNISPLVVEQGLHNNLGLHNGICSHKQPCDTLFKL